MQTLPLPSAAPTALDRPALMVGSLRVTCLLGAADTAGAYSLFEMITPPRDPGPPPHTHTREDEAFYVLEGEFTVVVDGQETRGGPGTWFFAPRHKPHAFRNDALTPSRVLVIASPAGFENFFQACGTPAPAAGLPTDPPTPAQLQKILDEMPNYGMTPHLPT